MAICAMAASQVPFTGYKAHTNNGSLFYTDGEEVFVSCMKVGCFQAMISNREGNWHAAKRIERLILNGETDADAIPEYVQASMGQSRMEFLEKLAKKNKKKRKRKHGEMQYEVGCHDFFHHHYHNDDTSTQQLWEIEGFIPIPEERRKRRIIVNKKACGKCTQGQTICVSDYVAIPAIDRWGSVSGDRTWIRISPEFLDLHLTSVTAV
jgi:predicted NBD/HSP70 family sugar kinase